MTSLGFYLKSFVLAFLLAPLLGDEVPHPLYLQPQWWEYYCGVEDLLPKISATKDLLKKLCDEAQNDESEAIKTLSQRLLVNLEALIKLRAYTPAVLEHPPYRESYSLEEEFELVTYIDGLKEELSGGKKDLAQMQKEQKQVSQHLDTLMIDYLQQSKPSFSKQKLGLELMALQAALAVIQENMRIANERASSLQEELGVAYHAQKASHHTLINYPPEALVEEVAKAQLAWERTLDDLLHAEMAAVGASGESPLERSKGFALQQRALLCAIRAGTDHAALLFHHLKSHLYGIKTIEYDLILNDLAALRINHSDWQASTIRELERLLQTISLESDDAELNFLHHKRNDQVQESFKGLKELQVRLQFNELLVDRIRAQALQQAGFSSAWLLFLDNTFNSCCDSFIDWLEAPRLKIGGVPLTILSLLRLLAIILAAFGISYLIQRVLRKLSHSYSGLSDSYLFLINKLIHYLILGLGFALAIASVGLNLSSLALVLGALSVGIGFGLQTIVNNFVSSLILLFSRSLNIGDHIELDSGEQGIVVAINIQSSVIRTADGSDVIVPNADLLSHRLINWTLNDPYKRLKIPFSVSRSNDKEVIRRIAADAAMAVSWTVISPPACPPPQVSFTCLGDDSYECELVVWVHIRQKDHQDDMLTSYLIALDDAFTKHKIALPSTSYDVRLLNER